MIVRKKSYALSAYTNSLYHFSVIKAVLEIIY